MHVGFFFLSVCMQEGSSVNNEMFLWEQRQNFLGNRKLRAKATSLPNKTQFSPSPPRTVIAGPCAFILNCEHLFNPNIILLFQRPHAVYFFAKIWFAKYNSGCFLCDPLFGALAQSRLFGVKGPRKNEIITHCGGVLSPYAFVISPSSFYRPLILLPSCNLALCLSSILSFLLPPFFLIDWFICNWIFSGSYKLLKVAMCVYVGECAF